MSFYQDTYAVKVYANTVGGYHFQNMSHGAGKNMAYLARFLLCHVKMQADACLLVYGQGTDSLCHNKEVPRQSCYAIVPPSNLLE